MINSKIIAVICSDLDGYFLFIIIQLENNLIFFLATIFLLLLDYYAFSEKIVLLIFTQFLYLKQKLE